MDYKHQVYDIITAMTGQANILTIPRPFIDYTGDIESALLLSQLIYWTDRTINPERYIFKTYKEWEEEIGLNEYAVRKCSKKLKDMGVLETAIKKANGNPTVHYRINTVKFTESFLENLKKRNFKNSSIESVNFKESLTEITTKITAKITTDIYTPPYEIFNHWNNKFIIKHRTLTDKIKRSINGALNNYSLEEIKTAIDNYNTILKDNKYYWSHTWTLQEFLQRGIDKFLNFEVAAANYIERGKKNGGLPGNDRVQDEGIGLSI